MSVPVVEVLEELCREPLREFSLADLFRVLEQRFGDRSSQANLGAIKVALLRLMDESLVLSRRGVLDGEDASRKRPLYRLGPGGRARLAELRRTERLQGDAQGGLSGAPQPA